ncbi:MAG: DoxX family protein [Bacteroidales bacterium]|nr:DoxX family protein [Bacteroidales bacterium]
MMKILRNVARLIIAPVFIFSGFVKAIDPLGSTYKFSDYFEAFGFGFLMPLSLVLAILLSTAELMIGLTLLLKLRMKAAAWALMLFMLFFTILTLIVAITNPVTDCGCFGDAIILTNWQTFFKNLIFLIPTLVVFWQRSEYEPLYKIRTEWIAVGLLAVSGMLLSIYCYRNLPFIDFRPYRIGANIPYSMKIPEGMPTDEYKTVLVYEKDGVQEEFKLDSKVAPWNDTTWKWVETKNILIREGYEPPIHDFTLTSKEGYDITEDILSDTGYSFLVVVNHLEKSSKKGLIAVNDFAVKAMANGHKVYGMTATPFHIIDQMKDLKFSYNYYTTDDITLKTIIRSNPGLMLVKEGNILGKWHYRNLPDEKIFEQNPMSFSILQVQKKRNAEFSLLITSIVFLLLVFTRYLKSFSKDL